MTEFETFLACLLVPAVYFLTYFAGKHRVFELMGKALEEKWQEYAERIKAEENEKLEDDDCVDGSY